MKDKRQTPIHKQISHPTNNVEQQLRREIAELKKQLEIAELGLIFAKGGAKELVNEIQRRDQVNKAAITSLKKQVERLSSQLPIEIMHPEGIPKSAPIRQQRPNGRWQSTLVGVTIICRDSNEAEYELVQLGGIYHGEKEVASRELAVAIRLLCTPLPSAEDLAKLPKGFEAITNDELIDIFWKLGLCDDQDAFETKRLDVFNASIWPKLDRFGYEKTKDEARTQWNYYINATFKKCEQRRSGLRKAGFALLSQPSEEIPKIEKENIR